MSAGFTVTLVVAVAIPLAARLLLTGLPLMQRATTLTFVEVALWILGVVGLAFHCGAMFFRDTVQHLPGMEVPVADIRALGPASVIWYVVPAVSVVLALRRLHAVWLLTVCLALVGIGVTMYDGGSLEAHLSAIFVGVVLLSALTATLVRLPQRRSPSSP